VRIWELFAKIKVKVSRASWVLQKQNRKGKKGSRTGQVELAGRTGQSKLDKQTGQAEQDRQQRRQNRTGRARQAKTGQANGTGRTRQAQRDIQKAEQGIRTGQI
jgi:hypothetical protein